MILDELKKKKKKKNHKTRKPELIKHLIFLALLIIVI